MSKGLLGRRSQKRPRRIQFSALHGFRQKPVRSSEVRGHLSKQASIWEDRSQKPVLSSEVHSRSSEQASVWEDRCQKPVGSSEVQSRSSEQASVCRKRFWSQSTRADIRGAQATQLLDGSTRPSAVEARANKVLDGSAQANFSLLERTWCCLQFEFEKEKGLLWEFLEGWKNTLKNFYIEIVHLEPELSIPSGAPKIN